VTHWKLLRDPYLAPLVARHGEAAAWEAGFFLDADPDDADLADVDWRCTPRPRRGPSGERPVVLLATGGFCPVHAGHLAMMERAREAATAAGHDVIGAYLSPGHDAYLRMKCGDGAIPASVRLRQCAEAAEPGGWISVDPWEALHRRVAVNFTDVAARLRAYLRAHVDPRVEVLYVCGGDNARFALAFTERGGCVVVGRPGAEREYDAWRARLGGHPRVLWAAGDVDASSRAVRAPRWGAAAPRRLVLREEDGRAVRTLGLAGFGDFQRALRGLLAASSAAVRVAPLAAPVGEGGDVISLDAMLPARHNLGLSRLFAVGGYEALGHVARPGWAPLPAQAAAIGPGRYALRDDDRVSGGTLRAALALLPPAVVVTDVRLAVAHHDDEEVADSRDFLLGADDGGLVLALPDGAVGRAPYLLPYVDPSARCCVAPGEARSFSAAVWSLNAAAFAGTGLRVADLPAPARAAFAWMGHDRALDEVCRWHAARLRALEAPAADR
jgi:nicotinic acid mononucleotide adenylyltransferase